MKNVLESWKGFVCLDTIKEVWNFSKRIYQVFNFDVLLFRYYCWILKVGKHQALGYFLPGPASSMERGSAFQSSHPSLATDVVFLRPGSQLCVTSISLNFSTNTIYWKEKGSGLFTLSSEWKGPLFPKQIGSLTLQMMSVPQSTTSVLINKQH